MGRGGKDDAGRHRVSLAVRVALGDLVAIAVAVIAAQLLPLGLPSYLFDDAPTALVPDPMQTFTSLGLILAWQVVLTVSRSRDKKLAGAGPEEYALVLKATMWLFGLGTIAAFAFQVTHVRAYILIALPVGLLLLVANRWLWRRWLVRRRADGQFMLRAVVIGNARSSQRIISEIARQPAAGYQAVGVAVPGAASNSHEFDGLPVLGDVSKVVGWMRQLGANTLIIGVSDQVSAQVIRGFSWELEPGREHLVMVPGLTDVAGPRIRLRPVAGLHLMHVETPTFVGTQQALKRLFDILGSSVLIVVSSPVLLVVALLIRVTSPGPALFAQVRVGHQGMPFRMLKFRSMVADAEDQLPGLLDEQRDAGNEVLFKLKHDPRVTPVGHIIRRYSIDELPQLFNVFVGNMSLVGPRPPLPREVATYEDHVHRKFLVRPGITGLWQVSGRSSLTWEESVRLDLSYVENWSFMGDVIILWRTLKTILSKTGAY